ncbi:MAG TPA: LCP family protein [Candidatus Limnocylindrales bacterium]|nr:LCP family protein [Candidatus Limnocylindrales bacterium]
MTPRPGRAVAAPSPLVAAVLSLLFPGLGHAYLRQWRRALAWAAAPFLLVAFIIGTVLRVNRYALAGLVVQDWVLTLILVVDVILAIYRIAATVDAWFRARRNTPVPASSPGGPLRSDRALARLARPGTWLSAVGLAVVLLVTAGAHVAVARYDLLLSNLLNCVFDDTGAAACGGTSGIPVATPSETAGDTGQPAVSLPPEGTPLPSASVAPWTGGPLNVLLVGVDQRPDQNVFNTDTMIVVSIDPATDRVAMFGIPRDTVDIPIPPGPLRQAIGSTYTGKINSIWAALHNRPDLCPGSTSLARGFNCLKQIMGYFYGLNIQYYAEVNFDGFRQVVDALGGVTIDVQAPVVDDRYPTSGQGDSRIYIPTGIQHMDGAQALIYARSRHGSNDFDRGARQQRVLTSLLQQADFQSIFANLDQLVAAFEQTVHTDVPRSALPQLLQLASQVDAKAIRSYVFAPPLYEREDYVPGVHDFIYPNVPLIRDAVRNAFTVDPNFEVTREKIAEEGGIVWVLNGSGQAMKAADVSAYLDYQGFAATAPTQRSRASSTTQIVVYNGAQTHLTESIARLEAIFGVAVVMKTDPSIHVDIVITVGRATPDLTPPALP